MSRYILSAAEQQIISFAACIMFFDNFRLAARSFAVPAGI
jgi:hypothetical protein